MTLFVIIPVCTGISPKTSNPRKGTEIFCAIFVARINRVSEDL